MSYRHYIYTIIQYVSLSVRSDLHVELGALPTMYHFLITPATLRRK